MSDPEDTFNKLKRIPFLEMNKIINEEFKKCGLVSEFIKYVRPSLFKKYGWTDSDYRKERDKYYDRS